MTFISGCRRTATSMVSYSVIPEIRHTLPVWQKKYGTTAMLGRKPLRRFTNAESVWKNIWKTHSVFNILLRPQCGILLIPFGIFTAPYHFSYRSNDIPPLNHYYLSRIIGMVSASGNKQQLMRRNRKSNDFAQGFPTFATQKQRDCTSRRRGCEQ